MNEPLGIALELAARRRALAARMSPLARRIAFPELFRKEPVAKPRTVTTTLPAIDDAWPTKREPLKARVRRLQSTGQLVVAVVARHWDVADTLVCAPTKRHVAVRPRRAAMNILREVFGLSLPTIGGLLYRDHSTVKTGLLRHADDYDLDADYRRRYDAAEAEVRSLILENAVTSDTTAAGGQVDGCTEHPSHRLPANQQREAA